MPGTEVLADALVKDAAGQEARPSDYGAMTLPARPFYQPLARALIEQRQILALDANRRPNVETALDALTIAPEKITKSGVYLGLRVAHARLVNARTDDDLRNVLDYLWSMARAIEDGDMSDAEQRLQAARQALEQALKDGASDEEIQRLTDELRQAMQEFLQSYMAEMQQRGLQNLPQMPGDQQMQMLSEQDLQEMLDRIEELAKLGDRDAAQELLSQLQQMLDNLQMAQPGQMQPMDQEAMRQMDELARMMREQQKLMDETFQLNQGRRPGDSRASSREPGAAFAGGVRAADEAAAGGPGQLAEQLQKLLEEMQGQQGQQGEQGEGQEGQQGQMGENGQGEGPGQELGRSLGRAGRAMGDATRSLGEGAPGDAYAHQGEALDALREGLQGMMQQMYAQQPGMQGQQMGGRPQRRPRPARPPAVAPRGRTSARRSRCPTRSTWSAPAASLRRSAHASASVFVRATSWITCSACSTWSEAGGRRPRQSHLSRRGIPILADVATARRRRGRRPSYESRGQSLRAGRLRPGCDDALRRLLTFMPTRSR